MGTHPIFESDFRLSNRYTSRIHKMHVRFNEEIVNVQTTDEIMNMVPSGEVLSRPLQAGLTLEQAGILENMNLTTQPGLLGGKVQGKAPKVDAEEKKKAKTGRAKRRMQYNRRFVNVVPSFGKKKGPNSNS